jgi:deoxyribonuclease-4
MGTVVGHRFEHLRAIRDRLEEPGRVGACLDTCHAFAAGYDLRSAEGFARAREEFDREVGLARLHAVHVNDCAGTLGSRLDRHAGLGLGSLGLASFRRVVRDPVLGRLPLILETPKGERDGEDLDARNLRLLRAQAGKTGKIDSESILPGFWGGA